MYMQGMVCCAVLWAGPGQHGKPSGVVQHKHSTLCLLQQGSVLLM